jgi:hypothetical protein
VNDAVGSVELQVEYTHVTSDRSPYARGVLLKGAGWHVEPPVAMSGAMTFHVDIGEIEARAFQPSTRERERNWIETSFSHSPRATGAFRLARPHDERYAKKHPISSADGVMAGFLIEGVRSLGDTFRCIYAAECFWIVHQRREAGIIGQYSSVSLVDRTGRFRFLRRGAKFGVVKSFEFGRGWPQTIRAFKLLDQGARLLYLTNYGFCLFDTKRRTMSGRVDFTDCAYQWSGFALSPATGLLAVGCSVRREKDPSDGRHRYENFVRLYYLESGTVAGEQGLHGDRQTEWTVQFSDDGEQMQLASPFTTQSFQLQTVG